MKKLEFHQNKSELLNSTIASVLTSFAHMKPLDYVIKEKLDNLLIKETILMEAELL